MKKNSREEDIKDIEKYISFTSKRENFSHDTDWNWNKDLANKIEHILSDYKRVLKENEELKKSKITYEAVRDIQEKNRNIVDNNYISKQIVKDNLIKHQEEYELLLEHPRTTRREKIK